jgi:hypothetical protein
VNNISRHLPTPKVDPDLSTLGSKGLLWPSAQNGTHWALSAEGLRGLMAIREGTMIVAVPLSSELIPRAVLPRFKGAEGKKGLDPWAIIIIDRIHSIDDS